MKKYRLHRSITKIIQIGFMSCFFCFLMCGVSVSQQFSQQAGFQQGNQEALTQPQAGGNKISLDIKGMEVTDVLKMLALRSGKNIVAGKNVRGKVTVFLKDVDVMDALEIILISNELAYDMKGDIINVMTDRDYEAIYGERFMDKKELKIVKLKYGKAAEVSKALNQIKSRIGKIVVDEISNSIVIVDAPQIISQMEGLIKEMDMPTQNRVFNLNYSKADNIKAKLEPILTKGIGTIQVDERTNKVIISDLTSNMSAIETAIMEFDEKTREVLIDSKILQITLNDEYKAGINWDAVFNGIKTQLGMNFDVITGRGSPIPTTATSAATGGGVHIGGLDTKYNAEAMIKFLQTYGKTNLLASPRIVTINNEEAKILVGTNQPYATSTTNQSGTGTATTSYQVTFLDLGIKLYVTPTINRDNFITMKIKPEVSSTSASYTYGANQDAVPIVKTSQAETTVMVKDGATIVIAGLIENREEEEIKKVPGIGDAPFVGGLFRSRTTGSTTSPEKNELVIFLTPRIISGDATSPEVERYIGLTDKLERQLTQKELKDISGAMKKDLKTDESKAGGSVLKTVVKEGAKEKPPKQEGSKKEIGIDGYYNIVRQMIFEEVRENYPSQPINGEVHLSFCIMQDGSLKGSPVLLKPANPLLKESAIKSIQRASPFPSFPSYFKKKEGVFKIVIIYE
jgi:type II secretory pathway component GspD/PulD (secretin)